MPDIKEKLRNIGLAALSKKLKAAFDAEDKIRNIIYAHALHGDEHFSEICSRLGEQHKAVLAYRQKDQITGDIILECHRRYGQAVQCRSMWPTLLMGMKRSAR